MIAEKFDTKPVELLLDKHRVHQTPYCQDFRGLDLIIAPNVFNPAYTKVSGLLADNLTIVHDSTVLDMFSGCGVLSFLAARKARAVVGIDICPDSVACAQTNAERLGLSEKTKFRNADLWSGISPDEKFDTIVANPPLLPALPENWLEGAVADSPNMATTKKFIQGCQPHLTESGFVLMAFSNACKVYFPDPLGFVFGIARDSGLSSRIRAEWDVGYEIYTILEFRKDAHG